MHSPEDLIRLTFLNAREKGLEEIQEDIDRARKKYHDVQEIQLKLDRRQEALDEVTKRTAVEKAEVMQPYYTAN